MAAPDTQVLIAGCGLVGAVTALLLERAGLRVACIDAAPRPAPVPRHDARLLALTHASQRILAHVGLWSRLAPEKIGVFERMRVWDENGGGRIEFDAADLPAECLGFAVEQSQLTAGLGTLLADSDMIRLFAGTAITGLAPEEGAIRVHAAGGETWRARLLVVADGADSKTRALAGIPVQRQDYGQTALAGIVRTALAHDRTARQRFMSTGPLAFLPMRESDFSGVIWSTTPSMAAELAAASAADFAARLGAAFEFTLGEILEVHARRAFPLARAFAEEYIGERVVLLGDAAHAIHPLAGQGANLGLLDAACLAEALGADFAKGRDPGGRRALRQYERRRKWENRLMLHAMDGFKHLFERQTPPVPCARNLGLDLLDRARPIKRLIARRATGLCGDLPAIVTG